MEATRTITTFPPLGPFSLAPPPTFREPLYTSRPKESSLATATKERFLKFIKGIDLTKEINIDLTEALPLERKIVLLKLAESENALENYGSYEKDAESMYFTLTNMAGDSTLSIEIVSSCYHIEYCKLQDVIPHIALDTIQFLELQLRSYLIHKK